MPPRIPHTLSHRNLNTTSTTIPLRRTFTTTLPLLTKPKVNPLKLLPKSAPQPPPYPYGLALFYKQANTGLYGGQSIQFGNNISERTETKTRRRWHPNIKRKQMFSRALGHKIRIKVSSRVMRTIDKVGGLDEYLMGESAGRVKELGVEGWNLRWAIVNRLAEQKRGRTDGRVQKVVGALKDLAQQRIDAGVVDVAPVAVPKRVKAKKQDQQLEDRIEQRLREQRARFMEETPVRLSMWQRMKSMIGLRA